MENNNNTTNNQIIPSINIPVTFYDGETELNVGPVEITPSLTFKAFQSLISTKLHISPHQITIYFQNYTTPSSSFGVVNHHRRRHPVTSKFDFGSLCRDTGSDHKSSTSSTVFWVVQKRSRRTRRRRNNNNNNNNNNHNMIGGGGGGGGFSILKRGEFIDYNYNYNYNNEFDYKMRLLEIEREKYVMSMSLNSNVYNDINIGGYFGNNIGGYNCNFSDDGGSSSTTSSVGFCDVCYRGGEAVPFHSCKNDVVTTVFRSPAGPIAPPMKKFDFLG